jgi:hypothetical protein
MDSNLKRAPGENSTIYMIDAGKLATCPKIKATFGKMDLELILDTGSQVSVISEDAYGQLKRFGSYLELPVQSAVLMNAFGGKSARVRRQVLLPFEIQGDYFEASFLVSPELIGPGLLGADFLYAYGFSIDLRLERISRGIPNEGTGVRHYELIGTERISESNETIKREGEDQGLILGVQVILHKGQELLRPSLVRPRSVEETKDAYSDSSCDKKIMGEDSQVQEGRKKENVGEEDITSYRIINEFEENRGDDCDDMLIDDESDDRYEENEEDDTYCEWSGGVSHIRYEDRRRCHRNYLRSHADAHHRKERES